MKCVLVAIGWENIALQALSAKLKESGHEVELAYDQALFDDKNYIKIDWAAKLLDQRKKLIQYIIELKPDLVGFHVQTVQYREMRLIAAELKKHYSVPVIFGGIHPHSAPDAVLNEDDGAVDMVCLGEGDFAIVELADSIEAGKIDYTIPNIWYRLENDEIIKTPRRPLIADLDILPPVDKELFAPHVPLKNSYLSCPSRGCPYACNFCSLSFLAEDARQLKGPRVRERSVDSLIAELKVHVEKYNSAWVDFRQPVMACSAKWMEEFFTKYKSEVGVPFRCFLHPKLVSERAVRAMHDAGCFAIQIGVECWNEEIRNTILNRPDTNDEIRAAADILESVGQDYAFDYILGIPRLPVREADGSTRPPTPEESLASIKVELMEFAEFLVPLKHCYRIAPFMLQYMPGTEMIEHGLAAGEIHIDEVDRIDNGFHDNYMSGGSVGLDKDRLRLLNGYRVMLRLMSFLSPNSKRLLLKWKAYNIFWMGPFRLFISLLDIAIATRDTDATTYVKNYIWWLKKRLDPKYHLSLFKRHKKFPLVEKQFRLPADGLLGEKVVDGFASMAASPQEEHEISNSVAAE